MTDYSCWGTSELIEELEKKDKKLSLVVNMLKGLLQWSDRIGSDETDEIEGIIKIAEK